MPAQRLTPFYRFLLIAIGSIALMIVDQRTTILQPARTVLTVLGAPFYSILALPERTGQFLRDYWPNDRLQQRIRTIEVENRQLHTDLQTLDAVKAERDRLLTLLSASQANANQTATLANAVNLELSGFDQQIVLDRGTEAGVYIGQPVIDAQGLLGQVTSVSYRSAVVTLVTDSSHAVPVEVVRNGLQGVVRGRGADASLVVPFLSFQADIQEGDILVTSGLGHAFPPDYPVATITAVLTEEGEPFLRVSAKPIAAFGHLRRVLLLEDGNRPAAVTEVAEPGE